MKYTINFLALALLLSSSCALNAGKKKKATPKASPAATTLTSIADALDLAAATQYNYDEPNASLAPSNNNSIVSNNNNDTTINPIFQPQDAAALSESKQRAQIEFNLMLNELTILNAALIATQARKTQIREKITQSSVDIWRLSTQLSALSRTAKTASSNAAAPIVTSPVSSSSSEQKPDDHDLVIVDSSATSASNNSSSSSTALSLVANPTTNASTPSTPANTGWISYIFGSSK